jgi:acetyltransferase-like isoleucine patch superfamily enzyme
MPPRSHGTGLFERAQLGSCGEGCVFEDGALVFHAENVHLGRDVYVGHRAMLKGYFKNTLRIGDGTWIGQNVFLHAAGGLEIGSHVGIGPGVQIITSLHREAGRAIPILHAPIEFAAVSVGDGADLGVGAIVLPGVRIGRGVQVGAGSVVTRDVPDFAVAAGNPARILRRRAE